MKTLIPVLFLFVALFSNCSKDNDSIQSNPDILIFGSYAGECIGNCADFYKIENNDLFTSDLEYFTSEDISFPTEPLTTDKYELAKPLLSDFPTDLLNSDKRTYGCPDCYDQGGVYLELRRDGEVNKWQIDTDDTDQNEAIINYKKQVISILNQLR